MTNYPSGDAYYNQGLPSPGKRPGALTTVAVLAIIFGSLGLFCGGISLVASLNPGANANETIRGLLKKTQTIYTIIAVAYIMIGLLMLVGGIMALGCKPMGKTLLIASALLSFVTYAGYVGAQLHYDDVNRQLTAEILKAQETASGKKLQVNPEHVHKVGKYGNFAVQGLLNVVLPGVFLLLLTRPQVVAAFSGGAQSEPR